MVTDEQAAEMLEKAKRAAPTGSDYALDVAGLLADRERTLGLLERASDEENSSKERARIRAEMRDILKEAGRGSELAEEMARDAAKIPNHVKERYT